MPRDLAAAGSSIVLSDQSSRIAKVSRSSHHSAGALEQSPGSPVVLGSVYALLLHGSDLCLEMRGYVCAFQM